MDHTTQVVWIHVKFFICCFFMLEATTGIHWVELFPATKLRNGYADWKTSPESPWTSGLEVNGWNFSLEWTSPLKCHSVVCVCGRGMDLSTLLISLRAVSCLARLWCLTFVTKHSKIKGAFSLSFRSAAFAVAALCNRQLWECKVCIGFLAPTAANPTLVAQGF